MKLSPSGLVAHARSAEGRKQMRYLGVSLFFVPVGQIFIQIFARVFGGNFTAASIVSAAILTVPNFFANKYLVWRNTSKENLHTQVVVFWVAAMFGITLATLLTFIVERWAADQSDLVKSLAVVVAQLTGFGIVWVIRYLILDRWLFKVTHHGSEPAPDEIDELHRDFPI